MDALKTLEFKTIRIARLVALIGLAGLLLLSGITVAEILTRLIFKYPIQGVFDLSQVLIVIIVAACLPLVGAERHHITVRLLGTVAGKRTGKIADIFGTLVTMLIFGLMSWQLWIYSNELSKTREATWLMHWPLSPWWRVATVIIALCAVIEFVLLLTSIGRAFTEKNDTVLMPK